MSALLALRRTQHSVGNLATGGSAALAEALVSGGDERLALDPYSGLNRYLCSALPMPASVWLSSCTASPISERSFAAAAELHWRLADVWSATDAAALALEILCSRIELAFGVADLAVAVPCPSGTDAMRMAMALLASGRPEMSVRLVLPSSAETGSGVPAAMAPDAASVTPSYVSLRNVLGEPRPGVAVSKDFADAATTATGRSVVVLTHGTKTGLNAPAEPPTGADVIVDACQARLSRSTLRGYLRRGWPVVVTGSKFYGGPAFSGAVLVPVARWSAPAVVRIATSVGADALNLGMMLRWEAALAEIEAFTEGGLDSASRVQECAAGVPARLAVCDSLTPIGGLVSSGDSWADHPTIFTFAVRNPRERDRRLSVQELRSIYVSLAQAGVLVGQPVDLGLFGGLRIAVGARDVCVDRFMEGLDRGLDLLKWTVRRHLAGGSVA